MADTEEVLLTDVSNSEALRALDDMVRKNELPPDRAALLKSKYQALHEALVKTMDNDKRLMARAKTLNTQLQGERTRLAGMGSAGDDRTGADLLREDAEAAESEAALCRDREQILQLEINDLQRQKYEWQAQVEEAEREAAELMAPTVRQYQSELVVLHEELDEATAKVTKNLKELEEARARRAELEEVKVKSTAAVEEEQRLLTMTSQLPEKIKKSVAVVETGLNQLKAQEERVMERLRQEEAKHATQVQRVKELSDDYAKMGVALDRARLAVQQRERAADDIQKQVDREGLEMEATLAEQARIDLELKSKLPDMRHAKEALTRSNKDNDLANRKYTKMLLSKKYEEQFIPPCHIDIKQLKLDKELNLKEQKEIRDVIANLKQDVDIRMNAYMKEESRGKEKGSVLAAMVAEVSELEEEVLMLSSEEKVRESTITELAAARERASRSASIQVNKAREAKEVLRVKELNIVDLKKKKKEVVVRLKDFQQLYDLVKTQRNKFVNLIQAMSQSIAELKEKVKILVNEVEILRSEVVVKAKLLVKAQADHAAAVVDRNYLQAELNKCAVVFRTKQDALDEQIAEIDKLNAIINGYEKQMLSLKRQYETQVEMRNHTGITLIDRNDELCILYEKANVQELVYKQGEVAVNMRTSEIHMMKLEVAALGRSIQSTKTLLPQIPLLDASIASLQQQLLRVRQESAQLSEDLEAPENKNRWRRLPGRIPDQEELTGKITQLEKRLNDKKEQLLEKQLVLEEISTLADRLRQQAAEGRSDTLELAKKVNDYQQRIRGTTRKMMATVSELSMYQASALKLQAEKHELTETIESAHNNVAEGLPPTADAEHEWERMERHREMLQEARERRAAEVVENDPATATSHTTAEPRPNAYLPEALGIPKPYGTYAPFKPSEQGSTMRHIRKPEPREIVI